ncbi:hypothetical protein [Lichenifustis flavocetrariae]|uniref:Uncharacterized protein n=1 Tax=Lichenifustis flavocetrariae TaxID=2949735 RepID=A0AA41Z4P6_9HYPH|nr:hypothetical protein [Lichenifustis flavocetrariae]MCW6512750.1 hypothetical protein [Lichenifustis flavocetrariae]
MQRSIDTLLSKREGLRCAIHSSFRKIHLLEAAWFVVAQAGSTILIGTAAAHSLAAVCARLGDTVLLHGSEEGWRLLAATHQGSTSPASPVTGAEKDFDTFRVQRGAGAICVQISFNSGCRE